MTDARGRVVVATSLAAALVLAPLLGETRAPARRAGPRVDASASASARAPAQPPPPLPSSLSVARVSVSLTGALAVVVTDVVYVRAERPSAWEAFVAYGAPGVPRAFDARLLAVPADRLFPDDDGGGIAAPTSHAPRAPDTAAGLLGPRTFAGQVVRVPDAPADAPLVALRLRSVVELPERDRTRSLVVRVSPPGATVPLGFVRVSGAGVANATATLCSPDGKTPLALDGPGPGLVPPSRAPRRPGEDLCVRAPL